MSLPKCKALVTAKAVEYQQFDKEEKDCSTPEHDKTMEDLPPEVLTIILEILTRNERKNNMLGYRLVNSQFKDIIDSLIEKKIISCQLPVFPGMKVLCSGGGHELFHVRQSPSMYPAGRNRFPFNSLLLRGNGDEIRPKNYFTNSFPDVRRKTIGLPEFLSIFGGYLTSFALHGVTVPGRNSLVKLLGSMPHLRRLSLGDVTLNDRIMEPSVVLPMTLPALPNLSTFESKAGHRIPHLWLIASYGDQLVRLTLETEEPLPALQKGKQYSESLAEGNTLYITTTSDSAFANVTELKINRVSKTFLRLSEFPKLKRLSVTGFADDYSRDLQDLTLFISKCRKTLENLCLNVTWEVLIGLEANDHFLRDGTMPPSTICGIESSCPTLKTLEIHYPERYRDSTVISRFLALFPALETLYFLHYPVYFTSTEDELQIVSKALKSGKQLDAHADQITALKTRLTSLEQDMMEKLHIFFQQCSLLRRNGLAYTRVHYELLQEMLDFKIAANNERSVIFKGLAALGERKQDVVMQLFLQAQGIWNICPKLKVVSVSSRGKPEGDVCVIRRTDNI